MIAASPLTGRIHSGPLNKAKTAFAAGKKDVTSEVLKALVDKAEFHGGTFVIEGYSRKWEVIVKETT